MVNHQRDKIGRALKIFVVVLILLGCANAFLPSAILTIAESYYNKAEHEQAKKYYHSLNKYFPKSNSTPYALERAAEMATSNELLMISPTGIGGAYNVKGKLSEEVLGYYTELAQRFPDTGQGKRAIRELTIHSIREEIDNGNIAKALNLLREYYGDDQQRKWDLTVAMEMAKELRAQGYYGEGVAVLEDAIELNKQVIYPDLYELLGDLYAAQGKAEQAKLNYQLVLNSNSEIVEREKEFASDKENQGINEYYLEKQTEIEGKLARLSNDPIKGGTVSGKISLLEEPLENTKLFLEPLNHPHHYPIGSTNALWTTSDEQGRFSFKFLAPGKYALGFVIDLSQLGDVVLAGGYFPKSTLYVEEEASYQWDFKLVETINALSPIDGLLIEEEYINFQWEPYPDASYYTLEIGSYRENGYSISPLSEKYYDSQAKLAINQLQLDRGGMSYDPEGPLPESLLGGTIPGGRHFWGVIAYDKDGNILSGSRGYANSQNTYFKLPENQIIEADKLLMERKYGAAIAAYEKNLQDNPEDVHSLRVLAAVHNVAIDEEIGNYPYTDHHKSLEYYNRLYQITGEIDYLKRIVDTYYYYLDAYQEAMTTLNIIAQHRQLSDFELLTLAKIECHFGNYHEALSYLDKANQRFYLEESALRIITGNFQDVDIKEDTDAREEQWLRAISRYADQYNGETINLRERLAEKTSLEAIKSLEEEKLTPEGELVKLAFQLVEPSLRSQQNRYILEYNQKNQHWRDLAQISRGLFPY